MQNIKIFLKKKKEKNKRQKKARERYQNFTEEEITKQGQCHREHNKNLSEGRRKKLL